jgi:carotenoid cleavage dioxygenase
MRVDVVRQYPNRLPEDDWHPYRTGAWRPNLTEYDATDLEVIEGELPKDLRGVYLRNTENPLLPSIGKYHPFDGDGMLHAIRFREGGADYRNRMIRTVGLEAELEAGEPLWAGIIESPDESKRTDGWGARTRMKDASSTDVVVHRGKALTTFYQCGDAYRLDPMTLAQEGRETWGGKFPSDWGISAHPRVDERTGELLFFNYSKQAPYMHVGSVNPAGELSLYTEVPLPGPRLPHDMAFTENFIIVNDFPMFWEPKRLERGIHSARYHPEMASRFALVPRKGGSPRWFEAAPTYVLHFANAYEEGSEVVLEGYFQHQPVPKVTPEEGPVALMMKFLDMNSLETRLHRWRFNVETGKTTEESLDDRFTEFPSIHGRFRGRPYRYVYAMTGKPGWFLFKGLTRYDRQTGELQEFQFPRGMIASETPVAPKVGATDEADAYLVTFVSDVNANKSECWVFDAKDITHGPVAKVKLPERLCSGTHAFWHPEG